MVAFYLFYGGMNFLSRFEVDFPLFLDPLVVDALVAILPPKYFSFQLPVKRILSLYSDYCSTKLVALTNNLF